MGSFYIGTPFLSQKVTELETALTAANSAITANAGDTATLQTWASDRVKFAYPNGGSEGDERTMVVGSIYVINSPFAAGVYSSSICEYFSSALNEWIPVMGFIYSDATGGHGVSSQSRMSKGLISVSTGSNALGTVAEHGGNFENFSGAGYSGKKWRVRCVRED